MKGEHRIIVGCGSSVEVFRDGFNEGAWSGGFDSEGSASATSCSATGMLLKHAFAELIGASHTLQALFLLELEDSVRVSDSIALLI